MVFLVLIYKMFVSCEINGFNGYIRTFLFIYESDAKKAAARDKGKNLIHISTHQWKFAKTIILM